MAHLFQVGVGSGGMAVLDAVARDDRFSKVTLLDPDLYAKANIERHLFGHSGVGRPKADLARDWLHERRPDLDIDAFSFDLTDPAYQSIIEQAIAKCDLGICAADNEPAKFHFDALMRKHRKPWTLGEVLAGGIGGFVHRFLPGGACYGCVASFLKRSVTVEREAVPDYSQPEGVISETRIPADRTSIAIIAGLHARITRDWLENRSAEGFTSLLFTLQVVPGIFEKAFQSHPFVIARLPNCLVCKPSEAPANLDVEVDRALERLGHG